MHTTPINTPHPPTQCAGTNTPKYASINSKYTQLPSLLSLTVSLYNHADINIIRQLSNPCKYLLPVSDDVGEERLVNDSVIPPLLHLKSKQCPGLQQGRFVVGINLVTTATALQQGRLVTTALQQGRLVTLSLIHI